MSEKIVFILHIHETRIVTVRFKHVRRFKAADGYFRAGKMRLYATVLKAIESVESLCGITQLRASKSLHGQTLHDRISDTDRLTGYCRNFSLPEVELEYMVVSAHPICWDDSFVPIPASARSSDSQVCNRYPAASDTGWALI